MKHIPLLNGLLLYFVNINAGTVIDKLDDYIITVAVSGKSDEPFPAIGKIKCAILGPKSRAGLMA